jgi:hypothetical protein
MTLTNVLETRWKTPGGVLLTAWCDLAKQKTQSEQ